MMMKSSKIRVIGVALIIIGAIIFISLGLSVLVKGNERVISSTPAIHPTEGKYYRVTWVIDGDTIVIKVGGKSTKVRLIGVDTPEIVESDKLTYTSRKSGKSVEAIQKRGFQARDFAIKLVKGKLVRVEFESGKISLDKYNRLLAYVFRKDGTFLNAELIRQGYGRVYRGYPFKYAAEFYKLEREARAKKLQIWKD